MTTFEGIIFLVTIAGMTGFIVKVLIPGQAAHRFRDDVAYPFRLIAARHSD
jgi:hypothetical protein